MKKKIWIPIVIVALLAILVIPIPTGVYKDGGTREYTALTYKIVDWNRMTGDATPGRMLPNDAVQKSFSVISSMMGVSPDSMASSYFCSASFFG